MTPEHPGEAGQAVLELGGDVGAAVIYATEALDGAEIEIREAGDDWEGVHTAVRKRRGESPLFAALFFNLRAGTYDVRVRGTEGFQTINVGGGRITEATME